MDARLVLAARRGDKQAFVEIVARHQAMVCGIALGVLGDFAASEDAGQEAFLTAWRKLHDLREPERLRPWLKQIAHTAALGHLRRRREHEPLDQAPAQVDASPGPDETAAKDEEAALVREWLAQLPETYRLPLILYYREGQSVRSVAQTLDLSEDAVKQRLARGRDLLRDRMAGLVETVLARTWPTPVFTMAIAVAIGALAAPAAVAGSVFAAASAGAAAASAPPASTTSFLTLMSASKTVLITAAFVALACIPAGYHVRATRYRLLAAQPVAPIAVLTPATAPDSAPSFEKSALFAEWRQLHETYGRGSNAMPALYRAIAGLKDPFRRRAFHTALVAEWVQVDPAGGLKFFVGKAPQESQRREFEDQRRQFFKEWLALDPRSAVEALLAAGPGWESLANDCLADIARRLPARLADVVSRLPAPEDSWEKPVRDAFAIAAAGNLAGARRAAESITGPNREQALSGCAQVWAKTDFEGALAWAKALPAGAERDEAIRATLEGEAAVNPAVALDQVGIVPSGGRHAWFGTTTGARVLRAAADTDFDAAVAWLTTHSGQLGREDVTGGLAGAVTERLNADGTGFLDRCAQDGSLAAILPAVESAILNSASGQRGVIWDWLKGQPDNAPTKSLKEEVLNSAGYQDPALALQLVADLPRTAEGDSRVSALANSLLNGGSMLYRLDPLLEQAPNRLKQPLLQAAFQALASRNSQDLVGDPQQWVSRLAQLPDSARAMGTLSLAHAWADRSPEEAVAWATGLPAGEARNGAVAAIADAWAAKDARSAAEWVASLQPGADRDRGAEAVVRAVASTSPREAWDWALSIQDPPGRDRAAAQVAKTMALRDPDTARQWIETGPFSAQTKVELQAALAQASALRGRR